MTLNPDDYKLTQEQQLVYDKLKDSFYHFHRQYPTMSYYGNIPAQYSENTVSPIQWMHFIEGWINTINDNEEHLNEDFNNFVNQFNKFLDEFPDYVVGLIKDKFDEERPGMIAEIMNGLEDTIFSTFKQPLGNNFLEKLENELNQRGVNITWFGAIGDGTTDNTASILKAYELAKKYNSSILVPDGKYFAKLSSDVDSKYFYGVGTINNSGKRFNVSANKNRSNFETLQNPMAISRYTYGRFNPATALSVSANTEDEAAVVGINDNSDGLSGYDNRDSVALYTTNTSNGWKLNTTGISFTANTVTIPEDVDLSLVRIGMFIDTNEKPKNTGIITAIVSNTIFVNRWITFGGTATGVIPVNNSDIIINPTTAIWGQNSVVQLNKENPIMSAVGYELDIINYQPHRTDINGYTAISGGTQPANAGFTARKIQTGQWYYSLLSKDSEYGVYHTGGSVGYYVENAKFTAFVSHNSPTVLASQNAASDKLIHAVDASNNELFTMLNSGNMNKFSLQRQMGTGALASPVMFAQGDVTLPSPASHRDEIIIITNVTTGDIKLNGTISYQGKQYNPMSLKSYATAMFICDGVEYYYTNFTNPVAPA